MALGVPWWHLGGDGWGKSGDVSLQGGLSEPVAFSGGLGLRRALGVMFRSVGGGMCRQGPRAGKGRVWPGALSCRRERRCCWGSSGVCSRCGRARMRMSASDSSPFSCVCL